MSKSTRHDRNYASWDNPEDISDDPPRTGVTLDPPDGKDDGWYGWVGEEWHALWQDTAKFHKQIGQTFSDLTVAQGGTEDAMDVNICFGCSWQHLRLSAGDRYVLTLKGGSCNNRLVDVLITKAAPIVDIEVGAWSSSDFSRSTHNVFRRWSRTDGKPVTYCYRWGCKPTFHNTKTTHLWWRTVGNTIHYASKYFWHRMLRFSDN